MSSLRHTLEITAINLRSIPQRLGSSAVICIGTAGVVAVLTTVLAMATGLRTAYASAAREDRVIVMSRGAHSEEISFLSRENLAAIESAPGVRRTAHGKPAVSAELLLQVNMTRKGAAGKGTESDDSFRA
jgi:putative ABC transport system permease protein